MTAEAPAAARTRIRRCACGARVKRRRVGEKADQRLASRPSIRPHARTVGSRSAVMMANSSIAVPAHRRG
ncbi:hypothetical protein R2362_09755 [Mycobacteroides chelonae]|nr:hypothetical protein [Mycobacteroides chelonae]MEC4833274.1 hypothetical protein [Mycobacteroides chelonae]MEC4834974.1 hypothetical protein [Mycobacteroides chelonae]